MIKLKYVMKQERIGLSLLFNTIKNQVEGTNKKPVPIANLSRIMNGKQIYMMEDTVEKILNGLNHLRTRTAPYVQDEIIGDVE